MTDPIDQLPDTRGTPSDVDVKVMRDLFGNIKNTNNHINWKKIIISSTIFVILSLPITDNLIKNSVMDSEVVSIAVKAIIFIIVLIIIDLV
jgi:hypothetical protein